MRTQQMLLAVALVFSLAATTYGQETRPSLESRFDKSVIEYVNSTLLREQDKNGDGFIDRSEWVNGNWSKSNPPEISDLNNDGKLSREELCIRISKSRGLPIDGVRWQPDFLPDMLMVLRPGQFVRLAKADSGGLEVVVLAEKEVERAKNLDKTYRPVTVKSVGPSYVVLTQTFTRDMRDVQLDRYISAHAIHMISLVRDEDPKINTP
jgi:hypothetical protein